LKQRDVEEQDYSAVPRRPGEQQWGRRRRRYSLLGGLFRAIVLLLAVDGAAGNAIGIHTRDRNGKEGVEEQQRR